MKRLLASIWDYLDITHPATKIQAVICFVLGVTLCVLVFNLVALGKQIRLTQTLNQPLCGVKDVRVDPVREDVKQITVIMKNYGKYIAKSATIALKIDVIQGSRSGKATVLNIKGLRSMMKTRPLDILPEQEFPALFIQFTKDDFNEIVRGDVDRLVRVEVVTEYDGIDGEKKRYSCSYLITRLADVRQDKYEISIETSNLD